jgi:tetratricopeptide (TPR) repeat protein
MMRSMLLFILIASISLPGAVQQGPVLEEQIARHLAAAREAEKNQDYPTASRQYEEILKQQPKLAMIRQSLAITYHLQNRYLDAISEFQRALRLDSTMWGSCLFLGMDYYKTNRFSLAIAPLENSISLNAKMAEPEARFWLAATYSALDRPEDAVRELRRDLVLRPANLDVLYYLTKAYDQAAAAAFQRLGVIEPRAAAVSLLQAERFLDENRRDLASLQYRTALALRPDLAGWIPALAGEDAGKRAVPDLTITATDARANLELATLLADAGDMRQSASVLQSLVNRKAANIQVTRIIEEAGAQLAGVQHTGPPVRLENAEDVLKGIELIRQGHFREAEERLSHAAEKNSNPSLQLLLIRSYVESGDCAPVEDRLRELLAAEPENVDLLLLTGRGYEQQAESTLQRMIQIDADSYGVHELLGKQHEEKTEYDPAIKEYQAALVKRPDLAGIHYAIGNVYRKMSRYDEAEKWLTEELARNPYHGLAHYRLGSIYTEQGKPNAAIPHLLQALQSHPHLIDAQLDLGRAYTADGKYEEAIATLKHVSREAPDNDRVHYLLSVVYSKEGRRADAQTEMAAYQRSTRDRLQHTQQDVRNLSNSLDR